VIPYGAAPSRAAAEPGIHIQPTSRASRERKWQSHPTA
jgi:hypothetical protein